MGSPSSSNLGRVLPDHIRASDEQFNEDCFSILTDSDESTVQRFLAQDRELYPYSYEASFSFYCHRLGFQPMKFLKDEMLVPFQFKDGRYVVVRPLGAWRPFVIEALARRWFRSSGVPVHFSKLSFKQFKDLSGIGGFASVKPALSLSDLSDDNYPQLIVSVEDLVRSVEDSSEVSAGMHPATSFLRRAIRTTKKRFSKLLRIELLDDPKKPAVESILDCWKEDFHSRYQRDTYCSPDDDRRNLEFPENDDFLTIPYLCLLNRQTDMIQNFGFVSYLGEQPVGFLFLAKTSEECAALYANLAITSYRWLSYYLLYETMKKMSQYKVRYINLGGQETNSLKYFYTKFNPFPLTHEEVRCYDLQYSHVS